MSGRIRVAAAVLTVVFAAVCASAAPAQPGIVRGRSVDAVTGRPLPFANIIVVGTTMGAQAQADGAFELRLPPGTYHLRCMLMGYAPESRAALVVDSGASVTVEFKLHTTTVLELPPIVVEADPPLVAVTDTDTRKRSDLESMAAMPIDNPVEALALANGIVNYGGVLHVHGGRGDEVKTQIDDVSITDPLGRTALNVGLLGTAEADIVTGGMDPEYGDAQSAVINLATREGGERFAGEFRYSTDDFGRSDKTYTNFDRVALALGGPTWWKPVRYFVSGEATWTDTENVTIEPRIEHKLTDFLKFRERQSTAYNLQGKLTWRATDLIKLNGEAIYSTARRDDYIHGWNVSGYAGKVWYFQQLNYAVVPEPGRTEVMEFGRVRVIDHGPWAGVQDEAERLRRLNIRPVIVRQLVRREDGTTDVETRTDFRAADLRAGGEIVTVVWDEAIRSGDGRITGYRPWPLFEGYQRELSGFKPFLQDPAGADSSFVAFNSATRTPETRTQNLHFKLGMTHTLRPGTFYALNVSRLDLHSASAVLDEHGRPKDPAEYSTAGLPVTLPDGTFLAGGITTPVWYTDDDVPYVATAYDYPLFADQRSVQWLLRGDITSEAFKGHRLKTGAQVIYNDLDNDERAFPGQQRVDVATGRVQQGLDVNQFRSFNTEGAVYVQDKWEYEGMVMNGGLRFEWLAVGNNDQILIHNADIDPTVDAFKSNISPRLGIAFPITDRDKFFFHYGRYTQWPSRVYLFNTQDPVGSTGTLGNPNLEPELTVSYQAGVAHQFTDDIAASFVVFNKDIYSLISSTTVTDDSTGIQSLRYVNRTYASSRGLELSLEKRLTRRVGFEVYYTFAFADGVASDADFGRSAAGLTHLPTDELPLDWDQRHSFNLTLRLADQNRWGATLIYQYGSGLPWTPVDRFARLQDPMLANSRRLEPWHDLSVQGRKQFNVYGRGLTLFVEGRNLLDDDILLPGGTRPGAFPPMVAAAMDNGSYLTETGRYGGAYLQDTDDDGQNEFHAVNDPTIWDAHRQWRLGLGFQF